MSGIPVSEPTKTETISRGEVDSGRFGEGWTGGQYSLVRVVFGLWLASGFLDGLAIPPDLPFVGESLPIARLWMAVALLASLLFAIGLRDRFAALILIATLACISLRSLPEVRPVLLYPIAVLVVHWALPPAPYGSWDARARTDPRGGWSMPRSLFLALWVALAAGYTIKGLVMLTSPAWLDGSALARLTIGAGVLHPSLSSLLFSIPETLLTIATWVALALHVAFVPLAFNRRTRPWVWGAMLVVQLIGNYLTGLTPFAIGIVFVHGVSFEPCWVASRRRGGELATLFYDGNCGLCHRTVRFLLAEDRHASIRYAPIMGERFRECVPEAERSGLPDSIILRLQDGQLLVRAAGTLEIGRRLGGYWTLLARLVGILPLRILDPAYDLLASNRHRLFQRPSDACPIVPAELRTRFDP